MAFLNLFSPLMKHQNQTANQITSHCVINIHEPSLRHSRFARPDRLKRRGGAFLTQEIPFISKSPSDVFLLCARHIYVHYSCTAAKYILNMYIRKMIDYKGLLVPVCNDVSKGQISCKNGNIPEYYCWNVMCVCVCVCVSH